MQHGVYIEIPVRRRAVSLGMPLRLAVTAPARLRTSRIAHVCREDLSAAAKELAQAQAAGIRLLTWGEPEYRSVYAKFMIPAAALCSRKY